ncbi:hypothetical protein RHGRI_027394 [Rhododendron griersonianum]|nr:hypothetical protein RHGRI_027394 [Rhododendron griersonianum]
MGDHEMLLTDTPLEYLCYNCCIGKKEEVAMNYCITIVLLLLLQFATSSNNIPDDFTFNGNLTLDGYAELGSNGLFTLTRQTYGYGHAFYTFPIQFKNSSNASVISFSTTFVFAIVPESPIRRGHGLAFVISPNKEIPRARPGQYLGLFNDTNNGKSSNHILAVELDTMYSSVFEDINDNHVGIDINGLNSTKSAPAGYFADQNGAFRKNGAFRNLSLISGEPMQVWVEYDGINRQLNVTMSPTNRPKPALPLLSLTKDLSPFLLEYMYVGFSSSAGYFRADHYLLGWSFKMNGQAQQIDMTRFPKLLRSRQVRDKNIKRILAIVLPTIAFLLLLVLIFGFLFMTRTKKFMEVLEDWEVQYGPHRFGYKDLFIATKGFKDRELLGRGGFGRVYRASGLFYLHQQWVEVIIHRDIKASNVLVDNEFNGRLGDFGLAKLCDHGTDPQTSHVAGTLGYIAPELARNGKASTSTDLFAFGTFMLEVVCGRRPVDRRASPEEVILVDWVFECLERGNILEAIDRQLGTEYLVEEAELLLKLGLLCSHAVAAARPSMSTVVQYLEGRAQLPDNLSDIIKSRDFGEASNEQDRWFVVEGQSTHEPHQEEVILVDWVFECLEKGNILGAIDRQLGTEYAVEEAELVLKLGLLCAHAIAAARPSMCTILQYLEDDFTFNGCLKLDGRAELGSNGLFTLNESAEGTIGHAFYSFPIQFKKSLNASVISFSTTFIFAIVSANGNYRGDGLAFVISPNKEIPGAFPKKYLGLFNSTNMEKSSNHIVAVELDTFLDYEFDDKDYNHVGIDINSLLSIESAPAGYFADQKWCFQEFKSHKRTFHHSCLWLAEDGMKMQAVLLLSKLPPDIVGEPIDAKLLYDAVNVILSLQRWFVVEGQYVDPRASPEEVILVDWVFECLERGNILEAIDKQLGTEYAVEEAELVLKLGLLCSHAIAAARPSMFNVVQYLEGRAQLPDNLGDIIKFRDFEEASNEQDIANSVPRICFLSGLTGEEMMMFVDAFPEIGLEPAVFAALVPNSADKPLQELIEEIMGDHEMLIFNLDSLQRDRARRCKMQIRDLKDQELNDSRYCVYVPIVLA